MDTLQWLVVVFLVPGGHAQACAFPSPCHHLAQTTDGETAWPKTTGSLHLKLSSFLPLGVLGLQGTPGRHWAQGIDEEQTCPREACL